MNNDVAGQANARHLIWIYPGAIATELDSATWLQTTRALRDLGWKVTLLAQGPARQQEVDGIAVTCVPTINKFLLGWLVYHLRLVMLLLAFWRTTDVVLFHQKTALWLLPLHQIRRLFGWQRPLFVMDTRDLNAVEGTFKNRLQMAYDHAIHKLANRWADGQTAITPRMATLVKIPDWQLLGTWPSGVHLDRFWGGSAKRCWPAADEPVQLMYIGRLLIERKLIPLCEAVAQANAQGMAFALTFVGAGPDQVAIEQAAQRSGGQIRVVPPVPHERIPELLAQAHVGVTSLPAPDNAKFQASSPIKLFEYMATGMPILATRNACHTDVVGDGRYTFWAEDATPACLLAALKQIWQARALLPTRGREAMQAVHGWTWQAAGRQLDQALRRGLSWAETQRTTRPRGHPERNESWLV